jgi:hypothetical protein
MLSGESRFYHFLFLGLMEVDGTTQNTTFFSVVSFEAER